MEIKSSGTHAAERLLEEIDHNSDLRERLESTPSREGKLAILREEGYLFTQQEWEAARGSLTTGELADETLETVSGGRVSEATKVGNWTRKIEKSHWLDDFLNLF